MGKINNMKTPNCIHCDSFKRCNKIKRKFLFWSSKISCLLLEWGGKCSEQEKHLKPSIIPPIPPIPPKPIRI